MSTASHILVENSPVIIYYSRNGAPQKLLPVLNRFLKTFWQERESLGENVDTPGCLEAQILVRFGFESCEDDFSNLRVGTAYDPQVDYLYHVGEDHTVTVWVPKAEYRDDPSSGLEACSELNSVTA